MNLSDSFSGLLLTHTLSIQLFLAVLTGFEPVHQVPIFTVRNYPTDLCVYQLRHRTLYYLLMYLLIHSLMVSILSKIPKHIPIIKNVQFISIFLVCSQDRIRTCMVTYELDFHRVFQGYSMLPLLLSLIHASTNSAT